MVNQQQGSNIEVIERMVRAEESVKSVANSLKGYIQQEGRKNSEMRSEIRLLIGKVDGISQNFAKERKQIKVEMEGFVEKYYLSEKDYFERTLEQNNVIDLKIIKSKFEVIKIMTMVGGAVVGTVALCQWAYMQLNGYSLVANVNIPVVKALTGVSNISIPKSEYLLDVLGFLW